MNRRQNNREYSGSGDFVGGERSAHDEIAQFALCLCCEKPSAVSRDKLRQGECALCSDCAAALGAPHDR